MQKDIIRLRNLRVSLKYRPEILKLILKMRLCIKKKNSLIFKLKEQLKVALKSNISCQPSTNETNLVKVSKNNDTEEYVYDNCERKQNENRVNAYSQTDHNKNLHTEDMEINKMQIDKDLINSLDTKDSSTQTDERLLNRNVSVSSDKKDNNKEVLAWNINNKDGVEEKSIAEQVKEVAQSALQQSGMVYVESAGMYYDYKTGYYYNSELGLYYHTDTGCYYYYSDEKQTFVFHSYPDRGAVSQNAALIAHEKRKARKHKKPTKTEDEIENLTKNLSQDKEDASEKASKPKRKKKSYKSKKDDNEFSSNDVKICALDAKAKMDEDIEMTDESKAKGEIKIENETGIVKSENEDEIKEKTNEDGQDSNDENLEDGECSETDSEIADVNDDNSVASTSTASDDEAVAKHHPPCMRVIVRETNIPKLKVGSLFLVTKDGGTVGREGNQHTILIGDHNVSRNHLDIRYNINQRIYTVTDLGSKNGTILNGSRMSESQVVSEPMEVLHGSVIQLGETKLLCHIHPGNDTCGHCEPGLIMETQEKEKKVAYTRTCSVQKQHQLELARLKNKYAPKQLMIEATEYNDRAQARRDAVGSSHHSEKTQSNDLDTHLTPENKGFKLLQKMGWSKGEGLGKECQGDTEPIPLVNNEGKVGLGNPGSSASALPVAPTIGKVSTLGPATLRLASRTKMLKPPAKAFQESLDDDSE